VPELAYFFFPGVMYRERATLFYAHLSSEDFSELLISIPGFVERE